MTTPGESSTNSGNLYELAERLGNLHESANALADCLQTRDVTRKTDLSMIEAAKCMFHKFLGEVSDDLERVTPQSRESLHAETTRDKRRCSLSETPSQKPCSRPQTASEVFRSLVLRQSVLRVDKFSLDLKFNPWDTALSSRREWHSMSKKDSLHTSESWCTEQQDAWLDDVKTFYHRPPRCLIVVHPYFLAQRDTDLLAESAHLSCAKIQVARAQAPTKSEREGTDALMVWGVGRGGGCWWFG